MEEGLYQRGASQCGARRPSAAFTGPPTTLVVCRHFTGDVLMITPDKGRLHGRVAEFSWFRWRRSLIFPFSGERPTPTAAPEWPTCQRQACRLVRTRRGAVVGRPALKAWWRAISGAAIRSPPHRRGFDQNRRSTRNRYFQRQSGQKPPTISILHRNPVASTTLLVLDEYAAPPTSRLPINQRSW